MKRVIAGVVAAVLMVGAGAASAAGRADKTARGVVTAVGADSVTVKVKDQDMKFGVDKQTLVTVRGGSTARRSAQAEGRAGASFGSLVKAGQTVEVHYSDTGMHAASLRVLPAGAAAAAAAAPASDAAPNGSSKPAATTLAGTVTAISGSSLTVKGSAGDTTFIVDDKTVVVGTGLGTKARETAAAGRKQVLADVVAVGDNVSVTSHDVAGARHAASVRVRAKGTSKH
jgi:hypothetical protein